MPASRFFRRKFMHRALTLSLLLLVTLTMTSLWAAPRARKKKLAYPPIMPGRRRKGRSFLPQKKLRSLRVMELVKHLGGGEVNFGNGILQSFFQKRKSPCVLEVAQGGNRRNPHRDVVVIEHWGERLKSVIFNPHQAQGLRRALSNVRIPVIDGVVQNALAPLGGIIGFGLAKR